MEAANKVYLVKQITSVGTQSSVLLGCCGYQHNMPNSEYDGAGLVYVSSCQSPLKSCLECGRGWQGVFIF